MSTATLPPPTHPTVVNGTRLFTAADLAALPTGDVKYELNDGVLVVMAPPGGDHGRKSGRVIRLLGRYGEEAGHGHVYAEAGVVLRRNPDRVVGADALFVATRSLPVRLGPEGYLETIPELVVEVRSKGDTGPEVEAKAAEYLAAGVTLIWSIDPIRQAVTAFRAGQPPAVFGPADALTADGVIPGFAVPVADLFAGP